MADEKRRCRFVRNIANRADAGLALFWLIRKFSIRYGRPLKLRNRIAYQPGQRNELFPTGDISTILQGSVLEQTAANTSLWMTDIAFSLMLARSFNLTVRCCRQVRRYALRRWAALQMSDARILFWTRSGLICRGKAKRSIQVNSRLSFLKVTTGQPVTNVRVILAI